jgi:hypothetical protein
MDVFLQHIATGNKLCMSAAETAHMLAREAHEN